MKLIGEAGIPPYQTVAFMGLFSAILIALYAATKGTIKDLWPKRPLHQTTCAALTLFCVVFNAIALKHLPLTLFYVTVFTQPMIIALLGSLFLKEHMTIGQITAIAMGFVGVLVAVNPFQDFSHGELIGYAAGTASAICGAVMFVGVRHLTRSESVLSITFYTSFLQAVGCGAALLWHAAPMTMPVLGIALLMGIFYAAANAASFIALKYTTASNFGQIHYTQIVTGALAGYVMWQDVPTVHLWIGAAIVIVSGLYIARHAHKTEQREKMIAGAP